MLFLISPAKSLDYDTPPQVATHTQPLFTRQSAQLIDVLKTHSPQQISELMKLSDALAGLNVARYQAWSPKFTAKNSKQAALAFDGDVYGGLDAKTLSEAQRVSHMLNQSTSLVRKYGSRAHVIGKLDRKLNMVDTAMEIKIADFDVSIDMLKKEFAFAQAARDATEQAKSAMLFTKGWELEYALDVVTNTIEMDLATTKENLLDLDTLTSQYSMDSDELYTKLDKLADQIKTDNYAVPESKKYANPNYKLSQEDKLESKGFGDIFN
jgi:hypothetical protein